MTKLGPDCPDESTLEFFVIMWLAVEDWIPRHALAALDEVFLHLDSVFLFTSCGMCCEHWTGAEWPFIQYNFARSLLDEVEMKVRDGGDEGTGLLAVDAPDTEYGLSQRIHLDAITLVQVFVRR